MALMMRNRERQFLRLGRLCYSLGLVLCLAHASGMSRARGQDSLPPPVTIQQAIQEALEKNLGLLAERYNLTIAEAHVITARLRPNPVLSLGGDHLNLVGPPFTEKNGGGPPEYSTRIDFLIEGGGKRGKRIEVAENALGVAQLQLLNSTRVLVLEVQNAFLDALLAKANLALTEESLKGFNQIVELNAARVRAGDLAAVELTRTRLAALQFQNATQQARSRLRLALQKLQLLMGRTAPAASFDIAGQPRLDPLPFTLAEIEEQAVSLRPDLQALKRDRARSLAEVRLQIAQGQIDYTIGTEYRRQQGVNGMASSLGFFLSVPLPIFNRNQGEISRARQEQLQIEARIHALAAEIRNEVRSTYQEYDTARSLLTTMEADMLEPTRQVLQTMNYSYRRGEASLVEFLDAQRIFNETMQSYNEARAGYARSLYAIDSVLGKEVQ